MKSHCEEVAERLALGESLAPLDEHLAGCAGCRQLVEMPRRIGAARQAVDPGLGFSARITAGAQHLIGVRRRRRVAAGLAATVAAGALGVFFVTREPDAPRPAVSRQEPKPEHDDAPPVPVGEADLKVLVNLADTRRSLRLSANWKGIEKPLAAYRKLVREVAVSSQGEAP